MNFRSGTKESEFRYSQARIFATLACGDECGDPVSMKAIFVNHGKAVRRQYRIPALNAARTILFVVLCPTMAVVHGAPSEFPTGTTILDSGKVQHGFVTLYTSLPKKAVFMLNNRGEVIHQWGNPDGPGALPIGEVVKPAPHGGIMTYLRMIPDDPKRRRLVELNLVGEIVWEYFHPGVPTLNHDFQRLPNGNMLILGSRIVDAPEITPGPVKDDVIFEVTRNQEVVWFWSTVKHFKQLGLSQEARRIIFEREIVSRNNEADIFHTNSIQSLPPNTLDDTDSRFAKGNILVSQRNTNLVYIIDKSTGKIVWRMKGKTVGQHHVKMIPPGLTGAGNILVFDNGGTAGYPREHRFTSRVIEVDPRTKQIRWSYDATDSGKTKRSFFSPFRSSAQRLPNGNTVITESEWGRIFEIDKNGKIVWEYVNPHFEDDDESSNRIYRGLRFSREWLNSDNYKYWW